MAKRSNKQLQITVGMDRSAYKAEAEKMRQEERQRTKEMLSDEQVAAKAKEQLIADTNRKRVQEAVKAATGEKEQIKEVLTTEQAAAQARIAIVNETNRKLVAEAIKTSTIEKASWEKVSGSIEGASSGVSGYLSGLMAIGTAASVFSQIEQHWVSLKKSTLEAVIEASNYREQLKLLAGIGQTPGETSPTLGKQLQFRAQTMLTREEAEKVNRGAREAAMAILPNKQLGIKGTISEQDFEGVVTSAGKMAAMYGGDAGGYGSVAGLLPFMMGPRKGEEMIRGSDVQSEMVRAYQTQQLGGFSDFTQFSNQFSKAGVLSMNKLYSPKEMNTLLSALSVGHGNEAATMLEQLTRATSSGLVRERGMKVSSDMDFEKTTDYMKRLGLNDKTPAFQRSMSVARDVAGQMKNPGFDYQIYLMQHGFTNQEDRNSIGALAAQVNTGLLDKGLIPLMDRQFRPDEIDQDFNRLLGKEPTLQARQVATLEDLGKVDKGIKNEGLTTLKRGAFAKLKAEGSVAASDNFDDWYNRNGIRASFDDMFYGGYHERVNLEAQRSVVSEALRLGIPAQVPLRGGGFGQGVSPQYMGDEKLDALYQQVQGRGGNPMAGFTKSMQQMADRMNASLNPVPPPMQGTPPGIQGVRP